MGRNAVPKASLSGLVLGRFPSFAIARCEAGGVEELSLDAIHIIVGCFAKVRASSYPRGSVVIALSYTIDDGLLNTLPDEAVEALRLSEYAVAPVPECL